MDELSHKISNYVRETRLDKNLTVTNVVNNCSLSRSYINMIESGRNPKTNKPIIPTLETVEQLCKGLGVSKIEFLTKVGFIDTRDDDPLLNYNMTLEELITYKTAVSNIAFDQLSFDEREHILTAVDEFINFQIFKILSRNK